MTEPMKKWPRTLVERLRAKADGYPYGRTDRVLVEAAEALEAAEGRIKRAIDEAHELLRTQEVNYEEDNFAAGQVDAAERIRRILVEGESE